MMLVHMYNILKVTQLQEFTQTTANLKVNKHLLFDRNEGNRLWTTRY